MTTALEITTGQAADGTPMLTVVGEIDLSNAQEFVDQLGAATSRTRRLVVDLTRVDYLDSAALAALFAHAATIDILISPLNEGLFTAYGVDQVTTVRVVPAAGP
jgi:ABC-type transporter Mla MlaB component